MQAAEQNRMRASNDVQETSSLRGSDRSIMSAELYQLFQRY
jgi:hypothetical protein